MVIHFFDSLTILVYIKIIYLLSWAILTGRLCCGDETWVAAGEFDEEGSLVLVEDSCLIGEDISLTLLVSLGSCLEK